ncbi:Bug family tripartite tricarboxylate transporter substrate binding protein [Rhodoplanes sp. Z2-YC6860]|uniref:Bug family tripartite tricarboxylate transporter substrate binding protein n=1 Tax=Rhodoplanes sp. Z2-YC6860 TaxID=674703 RepID=UPI0008299403|nr:tripartite tricarboxylate transporter substrate binding protein [Rhodoplanes sp. Z2-YC6860]
MMLSATIAVLAAADYPERPIKIIVPAPAGPILDILPRIISEKLAARWGQPVIVENRPGGANLIGTEAVMNAAPDGYMLLVAPPGSLVINPYFFPKPGYDPSVLVPVTLLAKLPPVVVTNSKRPFATLSDLISFAKANPGKLSYGSPGASSAPQLAMEQLMRAANINLIHVPYAGGLAPAERDLIAGHIDVMFDVVGNAWPLLQDGSLRALAVGATTRLPELPDVPSVAETIPGYVHDEWFAVLAPPKTPPEIIDKLSSAIAETLKMPDVAKRFGTFHVVPGGSSPAETAAFIKSENARWRQLSTTMGTKPESK